MNIGEFVSCFFLICLICYEKKIMVEIMCIVGEVEKTHILRLREDDVWDHSYHEFFLEKIHF
jgi:hypothetical protein